MLAELGPILMPPLFGQLTIGIETLCGRADIHLIAESGERLMADVVFLVIGCGLFGLLALYAAACDRL